MIQVQSIRVLLGAGLTASLLGGCGYSYKEVDADGDGYFLNGAEPDCWDAVEGPEGSGVSGAEIYAGADDVWYDGVDANCDGADDYDMDGDGFRCNEDATGPDGHCKLDCDDEDPAVNPGAAEICTDGMDNDCDGLQDTDDVDDGDGESDVFENTAFYLDEDGDGFGDENKDMGFQESCTALAGYSVYGGDCDDVNDQIKPGAAERCDDVDSDCDGDARDADSTDASTWYLDLDGDGYGVGSSTATACDAPTGYTADSDDCDDGDAAVNPGADEICDLDDVDEDCDGLADDEDLDGFLESSGTAYYPDEDGDGDGDDAADAVVLCEGGPSYSTSNSDCDDSDPEINPDAQEICDSAGVSEDCVNGANDSDPNTDPDTKSEFYLDGDGDGYGGDVTTLRCREGGGYVSDSTDCDDSDGDVYPGADEVCGDGTIADCLLTEGEAREVCATEATDAGDAELRRDTDQASEALGANLVAAGDTDGDGAADLVAVATGSDSRRGRVYVVVGSDLSGSGLIGEAFNSISGTKANDKLGSSAAVGGDVDGDGFDDLLLGSNVQDDGGLNTGSVYLIAGPLLGSSAVDAVRATQVTGDSLQLGLGASVALADLNGDDLADLLMGTVSYDNGSDTNIGAVYLFFGAPESGVLTTSAADVTLLGDKDGDHAGNALVAPVDLNGDGVGDVAVGVSGNNDAATDAGKVWLLFGPVDTDGALSTEADYSIRGAAANDLAGSSIAAAGDIDGDGIEDLLVGAPSAGSGAGAAYVIRGDADLAGSIGVASAYAVISGASTGDAAGTSMAGDFDLDGDDLGDVLIGAPAADGGGADSGTTWLLLSPVSGGVSLSSIGTAIDGSAAGDAFGSAVANAGDMDGDGWSDLVIGASGYDYLGTSGTGAVYLFTTWY